MRQVHTASDEGLLEAAEQLRTTALRSSFLPQPESSAARLWRRRGESQVQTASNKGLLEAAEQLRTTALRSSFQPVAGVQRRYSLAAGEAMCGGRIAFRGREDKHRVTEDT
jgi:hypothetical protein